MSVFTEPPSYQEITDSGLGTHLSPIVINYTCNVQRYQGSEAPLIFQHIKVPDRVWWTANHREIKQSKSGMRRASYLWRETRSHVQTDISK